MDSFTLSKRQSKEIAKAVYGDVKQYCHENFERYFAWYIDDVRKSKGKPPLETITITRNLCLHCNRYSSAISLVDTHCKRKQK